MTAHAKTFFRVIFSQLLSIFEAVSQVNDRNMRYNLFIDRLTNAFNDSFQDLTTKEISKSTGLSNLNDTAYSFKFFNDKNVMYSFTTSYVSFEDYMKLFETLKKFIKDQKHKVFFLLEKNTVNTITHELIYSDKVRENKSTASYYKISQLPTVYNASPNNSDSEELYDALILEGSSSDTDDLSIVKDFFSRPPESFSHFVRSILINYHIHHDGLKSIHICRSCNRIFLPQRSGEDRGIFCTDSCKKNLYNTTNKSFTNCIQNQKRRIETLEKNVNSNNETKKLFADIKTPSIDSNCRKCEAIQSAIANNISVKAGKCPVLLNDASFVLLSEEYRKTKDNQKLNRKTKKSLSSRLEDQKTHRDMG